MRIRLALLLTLACAAVAVGLPTAVGSQPDDNDAVFDKVQAAIKNKEPKCKDKPTGWGPNVRVTEWKCDGQRVGVAVSYLPTPEQAARLLEDSLDTPLPLPTSQLAGFGDKAYLQTGFDPKNKNRVRLYFRKAKVVVQLSGASRPITERLARHIAAALDADASQ